MSIRISCYITPAEFTKINKGDSVKYNFALFGLGTMEKMNIKLIGIK